jgi:hypothetical protein
MTMMFPYCMPVFLPAFMKKAGKPAMKKRKPKNAKGRLHKKHAV